MQLSRRLRVVLVGSSCCLLVVIYVPILLIVLSAFNPSRIPGWPVTTYSLHWFRLAFHDPFARAAFENSLSVGVLAAGLDRVLGSCLSFALSRFNFFRRNAVPLLFVLPIALPGIITGMALNSFISFSGVGFSLTTIIVGHATFCIVTVYNNVLARLRRTQASLV